MQQVAGHGGRIWGKLTLLQYSEPWALARWGVYLERELDGTGNAKYLVLRLSHWSLIYSFGDSYGWVGGRG